MKKILARIGGVLLSAAKKKIKLAAVRWALRKIMQAIADMLVKMIASALSKKVDKAPPDD